MRKSEKEMTMLARPIAIIEPELWELVKKRSLGKKRYASPQNREAVAKPLVETMHHKPIEWAAYTPDKWLLTHCTIVASCNVEDDDKHTITANSSKYINENGNGWKPQVILETYRTFVGAANYREHVQLPEMRKGDVVDAAVREVDDGPERVFYVDILVATDRRHADLVEDVEQGRLNSLSMGTIAYKTQCSRCGKVIGDSSENCVHIAHQMLHPYVDDKGVKRITAELCGIPGDPKSNIFVEASWVWHPAFKGAVINHFVTPPRKTRVASVKARQSTRDRFTNYLEEADQRLRVAYRLGHISSMAMGNTARVGDIAASISGLYGDN